jgi:hypothetical protein
MKITIWPSLDAKQPGTTGELTWEELGVFLNSPVDFCGEFETRGWSCASFVGNKRNLESVELVYALCLDFDATAPSDVLKVLLRGKQYYVHSSKRNSQHSPRYRAIVALSRPVNRGEYYRVWRMFTKPFSVPQLVDGQTKDPSRFWFVPCKTSATLWEFWSRTGESIDVDALIADSVELEKSETELRRKQQELILLSYQTDNDAGLIIKRAAAYLGTMDASIQGNNGSRALWHAALALTRGFGLPGVQAMALLESDYNPRCVPPWSQKELAHKVDGAERASRMKHSDGWLRDARSNWSQSAAVDMPPEPPPIPPPIDDDPTGPDGEMADAPEVAHIVERAKQIKASDIQLTAAERFGAYSMQRLCLDVLADVAKQPEPGCPIGIGDIDFAIGGIRKQMVGVIAGSTSFGKTTMLCMSANETCKVKKRPLILTFEDVPLLFGRKFVTMRKGLNAMAVRDRQITQRERRDIANAAAEAESTAMLVNCIGKSVEYAVRAIKEIVPSEGIDVVYVDYLQRIRTEKRTQDRRNEVTYVAGSLSDAIKQSNAGGVLLSQLKRIEGRIPTMDDIKESGDIECFAEFVILGWRNQMPGQQNGQSKEEKFAILPKSKDGMTLIDPMPLSWNPVTANFIPTERTVRDEPQNQAHRFEREIADLDNSIASYDD